MSERKLKYGIGIYLVLSHLVLIGLAIALYFANGFSIDEFTTVLAIVAPMFAGYTTSILAFIIKEARVLSDASPAVNRVYALFSFLMPSILVVVIAISFWLKAHNQVFGDFEDFKRFLLLMESLFAGYAGMFIYSLFEKQAPVGATVKQEPDAG